MNIHIIHSQLKNIYEIYQLYSETPCIFITKLSTDLSEQKHGRLFSLSGKKIYTILRLYCLFKNLHYLYLYHLINNRQCMHDKTVECGNNDSHYAIC